MGQAAAAGNRQPAQDHRKHENQYGAEREIWNGETKEREHTYDVVRGSPATPGRKHARGNPDRRADEHSGEAREQRNPVIP